MLPPWITTPPPVSVSGCVGSRLLATPACAYESSCVVIAEIGGSPRPVRSRFSTTKTCSGTVSASNAVTLRFIGPTPSSARASFVATRMSELAGGMFAGGFVGGSVPVIGRASPDGVPVNGPAVAGAGGSMTSAVETTPGTVVEAPASDAPPGEPNPVPRTTTMTVSPADRANRQ